MEKISWPPCFARVVIAVALLAATSGQCCFAFEPGFYNTLNNKKETEAIAHMCFLAEKGLDGACLISVSEGKFYLANKYDQMYARNALLAKVRHLEKKGLVVVKLMDVQPPLKPGQFFRDKANYFPENIARMQAQLPGMRKLVRKMGFKRGVFLCPSADSRIGYYILEDTTLAL